jgi:hypothetical protein
MIDGVESDATAEKLLPQEIDVKISQDMNLVNEVNINLNKHFNTLLIIKILYPQN